MELLGQQEYTTREELAGACDLSTRQITRIIGQLNADGESIELVPRRGYRLSHTLANVPVHLTAAEICLLLLVSRSAEAGLDGASRQLWAGLIAKIGNRLTQPSNSKMKRLDQQTMVHDKAPQQTLVPDVLASIEDATLRRLQLRIEYQGLTEEQTSQRQVHPLGLFLTSGTWYLQAFDEQKQQQRTFRLNRIRSANVLALPICDRHLSRKVEGFHKWSLTPGPDFLVQVTLSPELARWLAENPVHPMQRLDGCQLQFAARDLDRVVDWLLGLRGVTVQSPPELTERLAMRVSELYRNLRDTSCLAAL